MTLLEVYNLLNTEFGEINRLYLEGDVIGASTKMQDLAKTIYAEMESGDGSSGS